MATTISQNPNLIDAAKQLVLDELADGAWHSVDGLHSLIPDDMADACLQGMNENVYRDQPDRRQFGRWYLVHEAVKQLRSQDQVEHRTTGGKEEVRLDPAVVPAPSMSRSPTAKMVKAPALDASSARSMDTASSPVHEDPPAVVEQRQPEEHSASAPQPAASTVVPAAQVGTDAAGKQPPNAMRLSIDQIRVGPRHRKEMGDIPGLAASIKQLGLLQPIPLRPDYQLIAGQRRLEAVKLLGWTEVPVAIVSNLEDAVALLKAERDENQCRKDFEPSEAVAMGKAIEAIEAPQARHRQHGGRPKITCGKLPQVSGKGRTRDKAAEGVGMRPRTYAKAKAVVEAAEADSERFGYLVEQMDATGKVDPAFQEVQRRGGAKGKKKTALSTIAGNSAVETLTITRPTTPADKKDLAMKLIQFLGRDVIEEIAGLAVQPKPKPGNKAANKPSPATKTLKLRGNPAMRGGKRAQRGSDVPFMALY